MVTAGRLSQYPCDALEMEAGLPGNPLQPTRDSSLSLAAVLACQLFFFSLAATPRWEPRN